jgi:hypothetical protein
VAVAETGVATVEGIGPDAASAEPLSCKATMIVHAIRLATTARSRAARASTRAPLTVQVSLRGEGRRDRLPIRK